MYGRCWICRRWAQLRLSYGKNLRGQALAAGETHALDFPGFVPAYIRPLFCRGKGPFRWVALSGDPENIYRTSQVIVADGTRGGGTAFKGADE